MNPLPNPNERFEEVHSILEQLSNSQRHLLTAQVLMNDRMDRAERAIEKLAETMVALAQSQKDTDEKLNTLTDIIRRWYERHGNGQKPS